MPGDRAGNARQGNLHLVEEFVDTRARNACPRSGFQAKRQRPPRLFDSGVTAVAVAGVQLGQPGAQSVDAQMDRARKFLVVEQKHGNVARLGT